MKFLFDFFPILAFFIAFKITGNSESGIYTATAVLMIASFIQITVFWLMYKRFEKMHLITLAVVLLFGGATLLLHDERFIKWKPTVVNWLFGAVFLGSQFIGKKPIVQRLMERTIELPTGIWARLNWSWILFFVFLGGSNLFVVYQFDTDTWVNFKLFGMLGLTVLFVVGQSFYLMRHAKDA